MINRAYIFITLICLIFFAGLYYSVFPSQKQLPSNSTKLTIYTWMDFVPPELQKKFEDQTGIKLHIDYIDSDEGLEAKLLTGKAEYDIVYPSTPYVFRHIKLGLYAPLSLDKIPNIRHVDESFMQGLKTESTLYSIPYLWGTSGFAYDIETFDSIFPTEPIDSWTYVFDPNKLQKITHKGIASTASGNELFCAIGFWQNERPQAFTLKTIDTLTQLANQARSYWRVFLSSESAIQALGSGEVAVAFMWNGDALAAQQLALLRNKKIQYVVPKEGALKWIDGLAIPHNAPNANAAHLFINFLLDPEHMALVTNYVRFANTCSKSKKFIRPEILKNNIIYPNESIMQTLAIDTRSNPQFERTINRHFFKILVGY
jgi:putrescine transport system substrate-binding protein